MKVDTYLEVGTKPLPSAGRIAQAAEAIGFDGLWSNETKHDAFLPLVPAADRTTHLQLGTSVAIAFSRSPMVVAQLAWDLQDLSNGRLLLGLGTQVKGHIERRFSMPWGPPGPRIREYILALRALWRAFQTGERLDFRGQFYQHTLLMPFFNPGPIERPEIPVHLAGVNAPLARVAGEVADGFHVHPFHTPRYLREVIRPALAGGAARADRSPGDITVVTSAFVVTGDSPAELAQRREQVRGQIGFYASTPTYRSVLELHGWQEIGERLSRLAAAKQWNQLPALITDEMLRTFAVEAPPDEVGVVLRERYAGLVDRISCYLPFLPGADDPFWRDLIRAVRSP